jgi:A/G-specific adenine glycosylase
MEFGASVCRSSSPRCDACPIADGCPSRGVAVSVPVTRQAPLRGSDRAYRGAVVRLLAQLDGEGLAEPALRRRVAADPRVGPTLDNDRWARVLDALERDGLVHRAGGVVRLGAITIGA